MNIGGRQLTTKEESRKKWEISCLDYVNDEIAEAIKNQWSYTTLIKSKMFPELINELKDSFDITSNTGSNLVISWK